MYLANKVGYSEGLWIEVTKMGMSSNFTENDTVLING